MTDRIQLHIEAVQKTDYPEIVEVWEASVRATHHFISEADIQYFKPLILNEYLDHVDLVCVRNEIKHISGFLGTAGDKLEMLFVHPACFGKGIGRFLLNYAVKEKNITKVDVNEQNEKAVGFYRHAGFKIVSRSPVDGLGKPFPVLSMELEK